MPPSHFTTPPDTTTTARPPSSTEPLVTGPTAPVVTETKTPAVTTPPQPSLVSDQVRTSSTAPAGAYPAGVSAAGIEAGPSDNFIATAVAVHPETVSSAPISSETVSSAPLPSETVSSAPPGVTRPEATASPPLPTPAIEPPPSSDRVTNGDMTCTEAVLTNANPNHSERTVKQPLTSASTNFEDMLYSSSPDSNQADALAPEHPVSTTEAAEVVPSEVPDRDSGEILSQNDQQAAEEQGDGPEDSEEHVDISKISEEQSAIPRVSESEVSSSEPQSSEDLSVKDSTENAPTQVTTGEENPDSQITEPVSEPASEPQVPVDNSVLESPPDITSTDPASENDVSLPEPSTVNVSFPEATSVPKLPLQSDSLSQTSPSSLDSPDQNFCRTPARSSSESDYVLCTKSESELSSGLGSISSRSSGVLVDNVSELSVMETESRTKEETLVETFTELKLSSESAADEAEVKGEEIAKDEMEEAVKDLEEEKEKEEEEEEHYTTFFTSSQRKPNSIGVSGLLNLQLLSCSNCGIFYYQNRRILYPKFVYLLTLALNLTTKHISSQIYQFVSGETKFLNINVTQPSYILVHGGDTTTKNSIMKQMVEVWVKLSLPVMVVSPELSTVSSHSDIDFYQFKTITGSSDLAYNNLRCLVS